MFCCTFYNHWGIYWHAMYIYLPNLSLKCLEKDSMCLSAWLISHPKTQQRTHIRVPLVPRSGMQNCFTIPCKCMASVKYIQHCSCPSAMPVSTQKWLVESWYAQFHQVSHNLQMWIRCIRSHIKNWVQSHIVLTRGSLAQIGFTGG